MKNLSKAITQEIISAQVIFFLWMEIISCQMESFHNKENKSFSVEGSDVVKGNDFL